MIKFLLFSFFVMLLLPFVSATELAKKVEVWQKPQPIFDQKYDWLRLTSDEWLKGEIISMYDDELEFDSDEFDIQTFDWEDVAELRSRFDQRIRLNNGQVLQGFLIVKDGKVIILSDGKAHEFELNSLLSITSSGESRRSLWSGNIGLGLNLLLGNVGQKDLTTTAKIERRTPETRLRGDLIFNYSEADNQETGEKVVKADSRRITSYFDWFYSTDVFFRVLDFEHFSDILQNIKTRNTYGLALGYHLIDNKRIMWDITAGPSYQTTEFENSVSNDSESSGVLSLGTLLEYEISSDIDFVFNYQLQFVNEESGDRLQSIKTGFSFDFPYDIDLDFNLYVDSVANPIVNGEGITPEKNDFRFIVSFGYEF